MRALNARPRSRPRRRDPRCRPLARARPRSARGPLASRAREFAAPDTSEPFSHKCKPQVHRQRSIEAPFKLHFIGCRTTLPHRMESYWILCSSGKFMFRRKLKSIYTPRISLDHWSKLRSFTQVVHVDSRLVIFTDLAAPFLFERRSNTCGHVFRTCDHEFRRDSRKVFSTRVSIRCVFTVKIRGTPIELTAGAKLRINRTVQN